MRCHVQASAEVEWTFVSTKRPCSICGGHEGCRIGEGEQFACCVRTSSDWPLTTGGWVHRLSPSSGVQRRVAPLHLVAHVHAANATREEVADAVGIAS
jgi:hypothetical protein